MVLNSLPPATALSIVKEWKPEKAFAFGAILHKAIYVDGMHPEDIKGYGQYAEQIGLNAVAFSEAMSQDTFRKLAEQDFKLTN